MSNLHRHQTTTMEPLDLGRKPPRAVRARRARRAKGYAGPFDIARSIIGGLFSLASFGLLALVAVIVAGLVLFATVGNWMPRIADQVHDKVYPTDTTTQP